MEKVYCKNCKYFVRAGNSIDPDAGHGDSWGDHCGYEYIEGHYETIETPTWGKEKRFITNSRVVCNIHNRNFNCQFYKRKWWKVWA